MDPLTIWILVMASLWLLRMLVEELLAAIRGRPSPRIARKEARARLACQYGVPTVGQVISYRLAYRIAHPPRRRWAIELRVLLTELAEDAVEETRHRHHRARVRREQRRAQQAGWTARTGGPDPTPPPPPPPPSSSSGSAPPPPPDEEEVIDTRPCLRCRDALVVAPEELCERCAAAEPAQPPPVEPDGPPIPQQPAAEPDPEPEPIPAGDSTHYEGKDPQMPIHTVTADVRDPRTALAFVASCQGFGVGVIGQLDVLANNMERVGVGPAPITAIRVLADEVRGYCTSTGESIAAYAHHVVVQAEIAGDDDVRDTVRDTYLDTAGTDGAGPDTAPQASGSTPVIYAADCDTPAAGKHFMGEVARAFELLIASVDHVKGAHTRQGVTGEPIRFLEAQREATTRIAGQAGDAAATFAGHASRRDDTVGSDESLHGTQDGKYLDPARA